MSITSETVINRTISDFDNHPSVSMFASTGHNLDFSFSDLTQSYGADLLIGLNTKKSCGPEGFSPKVLKVAAPAIAAPLTELFKTTA